MPAAEINVQQARQAQLDGQLRLVDIREPYEHLTGMAEDSLAITQQALEHDPSQLRLQGAPPVALICQRGIRSAASAEKLAGGGFEVLSVAGGIDAWKAAGLPLTWPEAELNHSERERYLRHLALPQVGLEGQLKLRKASVLLVGAGGLGSPAALYLAAVGVGRIGIVDNDVVELSNLQRQVLHNMHWLDRPKVESAREYLHGLNDQIEVSTYPLRLESENIDIIIADYDLVIDGSDNFPTRYLVNDTCIRFGKPMVYGAVQRFSGQVSFFDAGRNRQRERAAPCYRCLFPEPPLEGDAPNCAEAGVLGIVPGVIGCLQATEAIKYFLGIGESLSGRLLIFDAMTMRFREATIRQDPACAFCG